MKLVKNHRLFETDFDDIFNPKEMNININFNDDYNGYFEYSIEMIVISFPKNIRDDEEKFFGTLNLIKTSLESVFDNMDIFGNISGLYFSLDPTYWSINSGCRTRNETFMTESHGIRFYNPESVIQDFTKNSSKISIGFKFNTSTHNISYRLLMKSFDILFSATQRIVTKHTKSDKSRVWSIEIYNGDDYRHQCFRVSNEIFYKIANKTTDAKTAPYLRKFFNVFIKDRKKVSEYIDFYKNQDTQDNIFSGNIIKILKMLNITMHQIKNGLFKFYKEEEDYYLVIPENRKHTIKDYTFERYNLNEIPELDNFHIIVNGTLKIECWKCNNVNIIQKMFYGPVNALEIQFYLYEPNPERRQSHLVSFGDVEIRKFKCYTYIGSKNPSARGNYTVPEITYKREPDNVEYYYTYYVGVGQSIKYDKVEKY